MGTKKSVIKNYIYNVSYQVLTILAPLVTAPYISRVLGPENVGTYSYTASIVTYFITLAILGTEGYARREIAYRQSNKSEYSTMFAEMFIFRVATTIFSFVVFMGVIWTKENRILYLIQAINIIAVAFDVTWFFQGMEEFGKIVFRNFLLRIANIVAIFVFVRSADDLNTYIFLLAFLPLLGHVSMWLYIPKYISKIEWRWNNVVKHLKGVIKLFIPTIAVAIYSALDKTMIGLFSVDSLQNGYYEQADKIVKLLLTIVNALSVVMAPRIAGTIAQKDELKMREYMEKSYRYIGFLALPMCFGLSLLAERFVPWFFGREYNGAVPVLQILSLLVPIVGFSSMTGVQYLIAVKKESVFTIALFGGAFVNFVCNLIFIPRYYAEGAAIATIMGEGMILLVEMIYVIRMEKKISYKNVFGGVPKYLLACICMYLVVWKLNSIMSDMVINLFLLLLIGCIVYLVTLLVLKDEFLLLLLKKIYKKLLPKKEYQ